jgi:alpha-D-xyloside xylohydrolase
MVYYDKLRYRLLPYIYSLAGLTYFNDYTIMRAMMMDFGSDPGVRNIGDQYMFGPSFLIAPVYSYQSRKREVYFPARTNWYDLYTGMHILGGRKLLADAPYGRMPVFVKEGSIIPAGPDIKYTSEKQADTITLFVYTGRSCSFTMYEDEGTNYNYENGKCSTIKFSYDEPSGILSIGNRSGAFDGMPEKRIFNIVWVTRDRPVGFDPDMNPDASLTYDGKDVVIRKDLK